MAKTAMTHVRLTPEVKEGAEAILKELGISVSTATEMFYRQIIANKGLPFDPRVPNKSTIQAMENARNGKGKRYRTVKEMKKDIGI